MSNAREDVQNLDQLLKKTSKEMQLSLLLVVLTAPTIDGMTCAIKPQGAFKSLGIRHGGKWIAAIGVNQSSLKGYFTRLANVDSERVKRELGEPSHRNDGDISISIRSFGDMQRFLSILKETV